MKDSSFDLVYLRKNDNRIFYAKKIIPGIYKIREGLDPSTEKKISRHELRRDFNFQERVSMESVRQKTKPILETKLA